MPTHWSEMGNMVNIISALKADLPGCRQLNDIIGRNTGRWPCGNISHPHCFHSEQLDHQPRRVNLQLQQPWVCSDQWEQSGEIHNKAGACRVQVSPQYYYSYRTCSQRGSVRRQACSYTWEEEMPPLGVLVLPVNLKVRQPVSQRWDVIKNMNRLQSEGWLYGT